MRSSGSSVKAQCLYCSDPAVSSTHRTFSTHNRAQGFILAECAQCQSSNVSAIHLGSANQSSKLLTSEGMIELSEPGMCKSQQSTINKKDKSETIWHHSNLNIDM